MTITESVQQLDTLRTRLASNLTAKGVTVSETEGLDSLVPKVENVKTGIELPVTTTATAADILSGKTAYTNLGELLTGTMIEHGTLIGTVTSSKSLPATQGTITNTTGYTSAVLPAGTSMVVILLNYGSGSSLGGIILDLDNVSKTGYFTKYVYSSLGSGGYLYVGLTSSTYYTASSRTLRLYWECKMINYYDETVTATVNCYA